MARFTVWPVVALAILVLLSLPDGWHLSRSDIDEREVAAGRSGGGADHQAAGSSVAAGDSITGTSVSSGAARVGATSSTVRTDPGKPAFDALAGWPGFAEAALRFDNEARDAQWATVTEGRLLSTISQLDGVALNRLEADCRESMCRLLLLYPPDIEPIYSVRQIYGRADELGLGPVLAETQVKPGEPAKLWVFLRRRL